MPSQKARSLLVDLAPKHRIFAKCILEGMTQIASAQAAGAKNPRQDANRWMLREDIQQVIVAVSNDIAEEVEFSRKEAHEMLMQAYMNAETASEQVMAVREMINLHALAKPKVIEHKHNHQHFGEIEHMANEELMKIAGMEDLVLEGEYEVVEDEDVPALIAPGKEANDPGYDT